MLKYFLYIISSLKFPEVESCPQRTTAISLYEKVRPKRVKIKKNGGYDHKCYENI